ncbi:MAG TPA: hypothetical protein EYH19_04755 [Desulfocapsa sulfexigens]|nr:hypothetical protein [Desulfocapsa sulfexigens]
MVLVFFIGQNAGLAHARLSIVDLEGGWQPITNEDRTLWIVFNGKIFNFFPELPKRLPRRGHEFSTHSDTEVILHIYEEKGADCLADLNGQFSIAIYDLQKQSLFLARDRMEIRPLFYTIHDGTVYFGSEIKCLFNANHDIIRQINPSVLSEVFTFWSPTGKETVFTGVKQLLPGHFMEIRESGSITPRCYWKYPGSHKRTRPVIVHVKGGIINNQGATGHRQALCTCYPTSSFKC